MSARVRMPKSYTAFCTRHRRQLVRFGIPELTQQIQNLAKRLAASRAELQGLQERLRMPPGEEARVYHDNWRALCTHPEVARVRTAGRTLVVRTKRIAIPYAGKTYDIGVFRIEVDLEDEGAPDIRLFNRTGRVKDTYGDCHEHPNFRHGGRVCLGNIAATVAEAVRRQKYATAIDLLIRFLKTYDDRDVHMCITAWSVLPKGGRRERQQS